MGCCFSKKSQEDEESNATTPLLEDHGTTITCPGPLSNNQEYIRWNSIVDRAAKKMINPNPSMNPLHPDEIKDRRKKYTEILNLVQPRPPLSIGRRLLHQQDISAVVGLLTEAKPYSDMGLSSHMLQVDCALKLKLAVHGDILVHMQAVRNRQSRSSSY
ncbi:hypothetical protein INT47_005473 [Mucor saturninus]|uniref:Uncharacterized protein n=1 Tax=Mucor saturninus TaxID=64648 RepID=A0A8H7V3V5_9FUNG|nr:hypothetical protein INT47_005473 [Mucor saturninus]